MFTFGFYNSLNGDRRYDATQMSSIFDGIIEDGVFANVGEHFEVIPGSDMQVIVKTGRAWFNHTWNLNDSWLALNIDAADTLRSRIDSVVLEVNSNTEVRENSIKVVKGELGSSPNPPTMVHADGVEQYRLANVTVKPLAITIEAADIDNKVGMSETPYVISPITKVDVSNLFTEWDREFQEWFADIKAQLAGDVAANLQLQINDRVKISDKASEEDLNSGTPNKWVDAEVFNDYLGLRRFDRIGDIWRSTNDIETLTNKQYIWMNNQPYTFEHEAPYYFKKTQTPIINKALITYSSDSYIIDGPSTPIYTVVTNERDIYNIVGKRIYKRNVDTGASSSYAPQNNADSITRIYKINDGLIFVTSYKSGSTFTVYMNYVSFDLQNAKEHTYLIYSGTNSTYAQMLIYAGVGYDGDHVFYCYSNDVRFIYTKDGQSWTQSTNAVRATNTTYITTDLNAYCLNNLHPAHFNSIDDKDCVYLNYTYNNTLYVYKNNYKTGLTAFTGGDYSYFTVGNQSGGSTTISYYLNGFLFTITSNSFYVYKIDNNRSRQDVYNNGIYGTSTLPKAVFFIETDDMYKFYIMDASLPSSSVSKGYDVCEISMDKNISNFNRKVYNFYYTSNRTILMGLPIFMCQNKNIDRILTSDCLRNSTVGGLDLSNLGCLQSYNTFDYNDTETINVYCIWYDDKLIIVSSSLATKIHKILSCDLKTYVLATDSEFDYIKVKDNQD